MAQVPNYGRIADRGQTIANAIQQSFNIMANAASSGIQEYKSNRTNENAYKHTRKYVIDNQERFGLSNEEADSMAQKLKFRKGEAVEAYEKRIAPTMSNMMVWDNYTKDPEYKIDLPDPFQKSDVFISSLENSQKRKKQKEIGDTVQDVVFGGRGGGLPVGTDISNIQEDIKNPSELQSAEQGVTQAGTQEDATSMIAGRLPGKPVSEKELQQFPAFRSLPTEAAGTAGRQAGANLEKTQAQTEATQALTKQRTTAERIDRLKSSSSKISDVKNLKDLNIIARLELTAKEALKDISKYGDEVGPMGDMVPKQSGTISEEWIDMKELTDMLKERRVVVSKGGQQPQGAEQGISPSKEAIIEADKITQEMNQQFPDTSSADALAEKTKLTAERITQFAKARGMTPSFSGIIDALRQGSTEADILERVIMASNQQQDSNPQPAQPQIGGGRLGR